MGFLLEKTVSLSFKTVDNAFDISEDWSFISLSTLFILLVKTGMDRLILLNLFAGLTFEQTSGKQIYRQMLGISMRKEVELK